jgi:hypothetical protein
LVFGYGFPIAGRNTSPYSHILPFPTQGGKKIKHNGKPIWKITLSVFTILMIMTLLSAGASAQVSCTKTPLGAGTPPATQCLSCACGNCIYYTAVAASKSDPKIVQFKDLSKGKETYIGWEFGDGTHLGGTKIASSLKNPVHKYKKTGYYITEFTIRCAKCGKLSWVHNNVVIK